MKPMLAAAALAAALAMPALADPDPSDWDAVTAEAQGQTVYWNAWGGSDVINDFIAWIGEQAAEQGVTLEHVKLTDTAEAVSRVLAEKTAGKDEGGAIDLIWINGENFASMKAQDLLFGPWAEALPNRNVAVARELTKLHEELRPGLPHGLVAYYEAHPPKGEIVLLVGPPPERVASPEYAEQLLADALRTLKPSQAAGQVAKATGLDRKELYARALELRSE